MGQTDGDWSTYHDEREKDGKLNELFVGEDRVFVHQCEKFDALQVESYLHMDCHKCCIDMVYPHYVTLYELLADFYIRKTSHSWCTYVTSLSYDTTGAFS